MGRTKITRAEYEALASFRYALRQFLHFSEQAAREAGLTPAQHQALLAIHGFPGRARSNVTVGDLAERLKIKHNSAVGLVDRLAHQGLLTRVPPQGDRRRVVVELTAQGVGVLEGLALVHREELLRVGPVLASLLVALRGEEARP
ncbi:MAG: MarR family transcriptional regulator [Acidobacteriota bacterium]